MKEQNSMRIGSTAIIAVSLFAVSVVLHANTEPVKQSAASTGQAVMGKTRPNDYIGNIRPQGYRQKLK